MKLLPPLFIFLGLTVALVLMGRMESVSWETPGYTYLGVGLALLILGGSLLGWFHRERVVGLFVSKERVEQFTAGTPPWEHWLRAGLLAAAVGLLCVALAGPRWGYVLEKSRANSLDVIIAVDTSRSMLAEDLSPNRMTRTQLAIKELLEMGEGDRYGLIPFAGSAFLQCPLTVDQGALRQHVDLVRVDLIPEGGTSIGEAIDAAIKAYAQHEEESHKVLVLFSDGEDHDANAVKKAEEAANNGLRIFTIGVGTPEGELVPVTQCSACEAPNVPGRDRCHECNARLSPATDFMRDEAGQAVRSQLNEPMLQEIAEITGGFYLPLRGARTMETLQKNGLAPLPKSENNNAMVRRPIERFQYPLGLGVALLLLELLWPAGRRAAARQSSVTASALLLALALPLSLFAETKPTLSDAHKLYRDGEFAPAKQAYEELLRLQPGNAKLHYNAGTAAYQAGQFNEAQKHFRAALRTEDLSLMNRTFYNLGNTQYRQGQAMGKPEDQILEWEQAAQFYESAVELNRRDTRSARNLKFVRSKIAEAKAKLEQLSDEVPLDGVTRFKQKQEKEITLRVFPPKRELIPERPYWRMFALDQYAGGVAKVSDSLRAKAGAARESHGTQPAGEAWQFRFEPLFSEFLPLPGPFTSTAVRDAAWHYNREAFQGRLPDVPSQAVNYSVTGARGNERLPATKADAPLNPDRRNSFAPEQDEQYPGTTLALNLRPEETAQLLTVIDAIRDANQTTAKPIDKFIHGATGFLQTNHQYTMQTRIPENFEEDPVVKWMMSKEPGHCEYFAYSFVLLARAAEHPARIVCGFAGGEWDDKTQSWVNVKTDAHAWAEIFDGTEWIRVDPTPPEQGQGEGEGNQQNQDPQQGNNNEGDPNQQQPGQGQQPNQPQQNQGDQPVDEDRDEGELPPELLETLRQAQRLLDALKNDEKPLSALEAERSRLGRGRRPPKKNW